jgi:hypothetical protein
MSKTSKLSKDQIAILKATHGDVFEVHCDGKYCYLKKPDRKTLSYATTVGQTDPMRYNEIVLENCWIDGDEAFKTNDDYFFAVVEVLDGIIAFKQAEIKKL